MVRHEHSHRAASRRSPTPRKRRPTSTKRGAPIVVKADGLAAGKGVVVAATSQEAHAAIDAMLTEQALRRRRRARGDRGIPARARKRASSSCATARTCCRSPPARTTSACRTATRGPNTGGMGAYSPAPVVTPKIHARVMREIILPAVQGMAKDGMPYTGFLYAGLMIDKAGNAEDARIQLPPGRSGNAADHPAPEVRPAGAGRARARRHARPGRSRLGPARRARRGARRARLSRGAAQRRRASRPAQAGRGLPVFHAGTRLEGKQRA